jgi:hypothetical protein
MQFRLSTLFVAVLICALAIALWQILPFGVFLAVWSGLTSFGVHRSDRHAASKCETPEGRFLLNIGAGAFWGVAAAFVMLVAAIALSVLASGFGDPADLEEQYITPGEAFMIGATFCTIFGGIFGCILGGTQGVVYFAQSVPADDAPTETEKREETDSE